HLDAAEDFLEFELEPGTLNKVVEIQNIPAGEGLVFDVSDSRNPVRIGGGDGTGTYEFAVPTDDGGTFALTSDQALATPVMELDTQPARWLRDTSEPLDYVIITYDDFGDAANMLADWRRDHLYGVTEERPAHVRVVNVSDVYDEFSYGMKDPAAIRYFLEYAFRYYGGAGADPLAYCVFLGDHTQDPRDNQGTGVLDYVTSWQDNRDSINFIRFGNVQYVSDDPLARFDGLTDTSTDLYLGRITVRTAAEARTLVRDKIIRNEENPDRGPWRNKVILVADDACQGRSDDSIALNHMTQTERVDTSIPQAFDRDKVYLWEYGEDCIVDSKPDAKRALLTTWTEGAWAVNYIGHGADVVLADEHVFDQVDIPLLGNDGRYPVFGAFSCSVGKFGKPLGEGLGEGLFKAPAGGALASMVATSITFSGANANLNQRFYEHMFPGEPTSPAPVGVALMDAKRGTADGNIKYVCIGDPASRPSVPERAMVVDGPTEMNRGDTVFMSLSIDGDPVDGVVDVRAQDAREAREAVFTNSRGQTTRTTYLRTGSNLYRGLAEVVAGEASVDFVVPLSLREGSDGRIRSYAWGETWDALGSLAPLAVGGEGFSPSDSTGPEAVFQLPSEVAIPGQTIEIVLEDPAGIDITQLFAFRGILLRIRDTQGIEQLRLDLTDNF
ncbi:MAG: hypothetical protein HKN21_07145, partial [Candidatus Eisenbacteria bacterium]|nr:hypothetical protein [Candidatus Eisenbacteria bacterium]